MLFSPLIASLALFSTTGWAVYILEDDYFATNFFDQFTFWNEQDPTNGFVQYQNRDSARAMGLINQTATNINMCVDSINKTPKGRPAVRITSKKSYSSGLVVIDVAHMPGGICATWPSFWTVGPNWPSGGEIDIFEGVNDQKSNDVTLHTGPGCSISDGGGFSGKLKHTKCASEYGDNTGCKIASSETNTYGSGFNRNGGGVYATEWTDKYIAVYFFPRGHIPDDVLGDSPSPATWGTPLAKFTGDCDFASHFVEQQLVFTNTFCGDWAGKTWSSSSCASKANTCDEFVENNPAAFEEAYWSVNALKVYKFNSAPSPAPSTVIHTSTSKVYVTSPVASVTAAPGPSTVVKTSTSIEYVAPSKSKAVPGATTLVISTQSAGGYAPVVGPSGKVEAQPAQNSPAESDGYSPIVGQDGLVRGDEDSPARSSKTRGGWWSTNADGSASYGGSSRWRHRRARHLGEHKRHSPRRL